MPAIRESLRGLTVDGPEPMMIRAANVFDKLKQLFGSPTEDTVTATGTTSSRPRAGAKSTAATARRPARPRKPRSEQTGPDVEGAATPPGGGFRQPAPTPREIPCPNCGEPM